MKRFWSKVEIAGECWEWTGALNPNGYGVFRFNYRTIGAHRMAYLLVYGELALGDTCHSCDNRKCVKPEHLWAGTRSDNMLDAVDKGRHRSVQYPRLLKHGMNAYKRRHCRCDYCKAVYSAWRKDYWQRTGK